MKNPMHRLSATLAVSRHKKKQGVAILTVLAIITLMTVLVVSFFNMAQNAKITAKGSVEIQRATTLKDTIINLVIAQFREASKLAPIDPGNPREIVSWTSQPGAIRTFSGNPGNTSRNRLYKLYSSDVPQLENIEMNETADLLDQINKDIEADWASRPDEFTDLNRPVYTSASGDRARANAQDSSIGYSFPIADPRAYNGNSGRADKLTNVEGFSYSDRSINKVIRGVDPQKEQLAMPVRWIYMLQDGTIGFKDTGGDFKSLSGNSGNQVSKENPIVARMAWWADDESCKINVNTASIPVAWDTPRTTSKEDQWLAENQPISGEFQRYPGHPATVDLSAVFYPNRRYVPQELFGLLGNDAPGGDMINLPYEDANRIWDLAPFIVGSSNQVKTGTAGTAGGSSPTPKDPVVGGSTDDRLFTSMDEVYFKATGSSNPSLNTPRNSLLSENKDKGLLFLRTLERAQFFLTHKSHSPELTNQGFPRVSMFPMDVKAVAAVGTNSLPSGVSPYDITMALNSTIGGKSNISGGNAYYFQRQDPTSRHAEFWANIPRNSAVMKYLKSLSQLPIPGYPETVPFVVPSMTPEDPKGLALASKYPPGRNGSTNKPFANLLSGSNSLADASDRTQTLWNMLDYTRTLNMQPAFITASARYDQGNGQAAGVCGCYSTGEHAAMLAYTRQDKRSPKGTGKLFGPSEIAVLINVAAYREGPAPAPPSSAAWAQTFSRLGPESIQRANDSDAGTRYLVEIGFIVAGFNPKHGWAATFPQGGITVSSTIGSPSSANNAVLPIRGPEGEQMLTFDATKAAGTNTRAQAKSGNDGVIPLGGMAGPRALMSTTAGAPAGSASGIAMIRPFCIKLPTSGGGQVDLGGVLKCDPTIPIRIMSMDGPSDDGNIIAATDIRLPADFFSGVKCTPSNETLSQMVTKWANGTSPFPDPKVTIRSFVVPHGDYRLTVTPSRVDADVYVPVANYKQSQQAHSFYEWNSNPGKRALTGSRWDPGLGLMDPLKVQRYVTSTGSDGNTTKLTGLPFPAADPASMSRASADMGIAKFVPSDTKIEDRASSSTNPQRKKVFAHGRLDGRGDGPNRGASDPFDTGDWDTGIAAAPDGPYMNYPDEGDRRSNMKDAYYKKLNLTKIKPNSEGLSGQNISPNFLIRSPVDFGSTPTGIMNRVPWQTLRFRPDPGMNDPALKMRQLSDFPPRGLPFANFCGPKDHFFLDMFWMPVVEPYSISEPFSTKGTINLNQQIFPFMYIQRTTALHALLRGERMAAIPNTAAEKYKNVNATNGEPAASQDNTYRHFINAKETIKQIIKRYEQGRDSEGTDGFPLAFNVFRSASEICELWLVPEYEGATPVNLQTVIGTVDAQSGEAKGFWADHKLTGDNLRERPYANIYPRVTVRSNVFKLHMVAQTLQKAASQDVKRFDSTKDVITAEWRGSCMIERSIDPRDTALNNLDYTTLNPLNIDPKRTPRLDGFYTYRVTEVKQLTQ